MLVEINGSDLPGIIGVMIPIVSIVGGLSLGFAGFYWRSRERMEMINRGLDISKLDDTPRRRRSPLRSGLIVLGAGVGLLLAYFLCNSGLINAPDNRSQTAISAGCIATFIGLGMILSHIIESKQPKDADDLK